MIVHYLKAKILVFAVFFIGIATGLFIANFYTTRVASAPDTVNAQERAQRAQKDIDKFYDYVGLSQGQREEVHKIAEDTRRQLREFREETQPRLKAIQDGGRAKIRMLLDDDQRKRYDEFHRKRDQRLKNRDRNFKKDRDLDQPGRK
jgi:MFS superfamily sulfate permease-like transporter